MGIVDWITIGAYFLIIGVIAWVSGRNQNSTKDYFLGGRNVGWFAIGASIFTANIGSEHIVGLAGSGAKTGMAMAHWEMHAWILILLAYFFVPFYYRAGVYTIPEFLERRFGAKVRALLSIVSLFAYVFTKVSVTVYAGAIVFQALLPDTFDSPETAFWVGAFSTVILTGIYTVFGGMRAILYTATPQAILLILGSGFITFYGLYELGGWGELVSSCKSNAAQFALWRPLGDPDFPWLGVLLASPIIGIWYWCTDQYIVQRTFAAKDLANARRGALWGGILKISPILIFLIPGLIGWSLCKKFPERFAVQDTDYMFPMLVNSLLPTGLRGLIVACMLAALMSSLASLFNSSASLFTVDIYQKIFPNRPQKELVFVGRLATTAIVGLGMLWIPIMKLISNGGLYQYLQSVQGYLAPSITAVFLLGLVWRRINAQGALWGMAGGFILGMFKLAVQTFFGKGKIESPAILAAIGDFNFLYTTVLLLLVSCAIMITVSLLTPPPPAEKVDKLTYFSLYSNAEDAAEIRASWDIWNKIFSAVIVLGVLGMYLYFSFWLG